MYLKQIRPVNDDVGLMEMTNACVKRIERSMRLVDDGLCVRNDGKAKIRTRISSENVDKINRAYLECRIEQKSRVPKLDIVTEIKTSESFHERKQVFAAAPLEIALLQLAMQRQLRLNLAAGACAAEAEEKMGQMTLSELVQVSKFPGVKKVKDLVVEFGVRWVEGVLYEVVKLSQNEMKELNALLARLTASQVFTLVGAFGIQAFVYGPTVLFQEWWKKESLQHTLLILVITLWSVKELLDLSDFCDAVLLKRAMSRARSAAMYFKAQVIELHLIFQTSDTQMMMDGHGLSSLGSRAYLMNALLMRWQKPYVCT